MADAGKSDGGKTCEPKDLDSMPPHIVATRDDTGGIQAPTGEHRD